MKNKWPTTTIGSIAYHDNDSMINVNPSDNYQMVGVYSFGKGLFDKEKLSGMNTSYKKFYRLKPNHIVMSQLFGWEGAIALCSPEYEGKYLSSQFPTFLVHEDQVDRKFLGYYLQQPKVWRALFEKGKGMGSRRRTLNPENLLSLEIDLPTLDEQRHIVKILEKTRFYIERIAQVRLQQAELLKTLCFSRYWESIENVDWMPLHTVAPIMRREININEHETYPELGIRSFGKGTFHKPALSGIEVGTKRLFRIERGDLMFSNVFAWEGAIAVAKNEDDGRFGSHRFISCVANRQRVLPEFICFHFLTQKGLEDINGASPGGAGRNKTLGVHKLMNIRVPVPKVTVQQTFIAEVNKLELIRAGHLETLQV